MVIKPTIERREETLSLSDNNKKNITIGQKSSEKIQKSGHDTGNSWVLGARLGHRNLEEFCGLGLDKLRDTHSGNLGRGGRCTKFEVNWTNVK